jgi:HEAT repeat protein
MDIGSYLRSISAPSHQLAMRDLKPLSDVDPAERRAFQDGWREIDVERRSQIVRAMVDLAEDNVDLHFQTAMLWCLEDDQGTIRVVAIEGLWESESPRVLRRMLELLRNDPEAEVREAAASGLARFAYLAELGELDDDDAALLLRDLMQIVEEPEKPVALRRRALESLGYFASEDSVQQQIQRAYISAELEMKESALVAMGRSMLPRWLPVIGKELESRSPALRYEAARAVGEFGEEGRPLIVPIARLLGDSDTEVALAAIWALGQLGGEAAKRALTEVARSDSDARVQAATEALAEIALDQGIGGEVRGIRPRGGSNN